MEEYKCSDENASQHDTEDGKQDSKMYASLNEGLEGKEQLTGIMDDMVDGMGRQKCRRDVKQDSEKYTIPEKGRCMISEES